MHVVIFEGSRWHTFAPVSLSRPVFTLVSGMSTLLEKQVRHLRPTRLTLWVRPELEEHCRVRLVPSLPVPTEVNRPLDDEPALLINGRTLLLGRYPPPQEFGVVADEQSRFVRAAYVRAPGLSPEDVNRRTARWLGLLDLPHTLPQNRLVESLWDLISWNEESLVGDFVHLRGQSTNPPPGRPAGPYHVLNERDVWIGDHATLGPGCVLDAGKGPVVLGEHAAVGANAVLTGPCYVGPHSTVMPLTQVRPGTSLGPFCKVGGEVSNSILLGYSNKAHEGFLGDSYLGKWVNLGSGTTTSNLKNTYGEITVPRGGKEVPTGRRFLGSLIGDHTKTGILTRLSAGSYLGFCCSIAASGIAPRFVPSFTFLTDRGPEPYRMDKAIEVIRRVFARRGRDWTETDERIMHYVEEAARGAEARPPENLPLNGNPKSESPNPRINDE